MPRTDSSQAFTLIEVLVVFAILAVIATMLLPRVSDRPGPASTPICLSNQRQILLGAMMYGEDFKKGLPNLDALPGNDGPSALSLITNYASQAKIFQCPIVVSWREKNGSGNATPVTPLLNPAFFRSNGNDYAYYDGIRVLSFSNAVTAERWAWTNRTAWTAKAKVKADGPLHANGRITAGFGDGHAEFLRADKVLGNDYNPPWSTVQDPLFRP